MQDEAGTRGMELETHNFMARRLYLYYLSLSHGGWGECLVPHYTRERVCLSLSLSLSLTGGRAKAWCLFIHTGCVSVCLYTGYELTMTCRTRSNPRPPSPVYCLLSQTTSHE